MKTFTADNGDVFLIAEDNDTPIAVLKSRELSDDMRELLAQGYIIPVCKMILNVRRIREAELEEIVKPHE